jgi:hypothetical protein
LSPGAHRAPAMSDAIKKLAPIEPSIIATIKQTQLDAFQVEANQFQVLSMFSLTEALNHLELDESCRDWDVRLTFI